MAFDPVLADKRFGCGLSSEIASPDSVSAMLDGMQGQDVMAVRYPIENFDVVLERLREFQKNTRVRNTRRGSEEGNAAQKVIQQLNLDATRDQFRWLATHIARCVHSTTPFLERLDSFWADHFTARGKNGVVRQSVSAYREEAIRPYIRGDFATLLINAVTHPMMVHYLDQDQSLGPNSRALANQGRKGGLNENLAREIMELHSLGVGAPYSQKDVRQLAELLTGLTFDLGRGRVFRPGMAEPGAETVLGKSYGGEDSTLDDIFEVLQDLARHPATARHMARKLAVYFVSDKPDPDLVATVETAWLQTEGYLPAVYEALLSHPAAWTPSGGNMKQPFDYIASSIRALGIGADTLLGLKSAQVRMWISEPLRLMGQPWQLPAGPDGLEEADATWLTPPSIAARLQWALTVPQRLKRQLPDPRDFVATALGPDVPEAVRFAAGAAESRSDGIGLILASPAFQRM